jgi:hypothetical protein
MLKKRNCYKRKETALAVSLRVLLYAVVGIAFIGLAIQCLEKSELPIWMTMACFFLFGTTGTGLLCPAIFGIGKCILKAKNWLKKNIWWENFRRKEIYFPFR